MSFLSHSQYEVKKKKAMLYQISQVSQYRMFLVNPLHPKISMYILHSVLYTFPTVLTRGICFMIKKKKKAYLMTQPH